MCGIAGMVEGTRGGTGARTGRRDEVASMLESLAHRGPDGEGIVEAGPAVLGHRRLATIDLSERASQPMALRCANSEADPSVWIVFNGEIYNYVELRRELSGRGHHFHSDSDTEVILHLYEEAGERCLPRLNGMFALALWDGRARRLLLARDRVGKKPLYYRRTAEGVQFASEIKALARLARLRGEALTQDPAALRAYLALKYIPGPGTIWQGVHSLPAAHYLIHEDGQQRIIPYWELPQPATVPPASLPAVRDELAATIGEAVRIRMRSDVPLGLFLSGGLDSAIIASCMTVAASGSELPSRVRSFTAGFPEGDYDEVSRAARVARALGMEHEVIRLDASPARVADSLPAIAWHLDQPFADSSALAVWHLAKAVRQHVTVALSGDGGDELFLGYDRYRAHRLAGLAPVALAFGLSALASIARKLPGPHTRRNLAGRATRFADAAAMPPGARNDAWVTSLDAAMASRLLTGDFVEAAGSADPLAALHAAENSVPAGADPIEGIQRADLRVWLPDDVLHKVDAMTMAHSLEARSPLLDVNVIEAALRIPASQHLPLGFGRGKRILRETFRRRLPKGAGTGRKAGFGLPIDHWLRGVLSGWCRDLLLDRRTLERGILRKSGVESLLEEHRSGAANREDALWSLIMLEQWHRAVAEDSSRMSQREGAAVRLNEAGR